MFNIVDVLPSCTPGLLEEVRDLFREYAESLGFDLEFQGFVRELEELPGQYAPPRGCLLLAYPGELAQTGVLSAAGCGALRPLDEEVCEMKRLYVRPRHRGRGLGRALSLRLIEKAAGLGYRRVRLDTLSSMQEATALYRSLGFEEIPAYYYNPLPGPLFFERKLS